MLVYKIFRAPEWAELQSAGKTLGAPIDLEDSFIHLSNGETVAETCRLYFADQEGLVLLALDADKLGDTLKWEASRGGIQFPHLYRPLLLSDVLWDKPLPLGPDGHIFPEDLA